MRKCFWLPPPYLQDPSASQVDAREEGAGKRARKSPVKHTGRPSSRDQGANSIIVVARRPRKEE